MGDTSDVNTKVFLQMLSYQCNIVSLPRVNLPLTPCLFAPLPTSHMLVLKQKEPMHWLLLKSPVLPLPPLISLASVTHAFAFESGECCPFSPLLLGVYSLAQHFSDLIVPRNQLGIF